MLEKIREFPESPGVYLMKKDNEIIYVGKAKNLKKRVSSYFNREHEDNKTRELVKKVEKIEYIICNSEIDALILENNLIKKHQPKYNILLKDEKTYPYVKISKELFPKLSIIRTTKSFEDKSANYFGPYPQGIYGWMKVLKKTFPIRDCNRDMNKKYDRPCLKYHMKLCLGPCVYKDIEKEYTETLKELREFLKGDVKEVIKFYKNSMELSSENMDFEKAIQYREKIRDLEKLKQNQISELGKNLDEDIFVYKLENLRLFICVLTVREGKIVGKLSFNQEIDELYKEELFINIVTDFYSKHPIPKNLVFQDELESFEELINAWIKAKSEGAVKVYFPKIKSRKKELLEMALLNLEKDMEKYYSSKKVVEEALINLYKTLGLKKYPRRIECYDISNIQGADAVASMSVAIDGKNKNSEYRKFKIRTKSTPDDFEMMREVMTRRFSKLEEKDYPDLLLIDGGKGQLNACGQIIYNLGLYGKIELISIAKREEEIFKLGESEPYIFSKREETLKILQRLRDEAHRFGITYHRKLRSKRVISSELDKIEGIGEQRKKNLLKKFGSVAEIKKATYEELKEILPERIIENLQKYLKGDVQN
ncbi:MAG: excinuclease ABC subunit UvrC [Fusobacteriaceae bacterium]|nr:excinuclease ABC subunit UvrC [Fusobacteriaceae bacterium]